MEISLSIAMLLFVALLAIRRRLTRRRIRDIGMARKFRDLYFEEAQALLADRRLPEKCVRHLRVLASGMVRTIAPYLVFVALLIVRKGEPKADESLPTEFRAAMIKANAFALLSVSYQSQLVGPVIRTMLGLGSDKKKVNGPQSPKVNKVAEKVARFELRHAVAT